MYTSRISGLGHFVPENIVTNEDLSKLMDTNDEWIQERTGIKERRWIKKEVMKLLHLWVQKLPEMPLQKLVLIRMILILSFLRP